MKRIFVTFVALVFTLSILIGCTNKPAKMLFYDDYLEKNKLFYVTQGSGELKPSTLLSNFESWLYTSPDGSRLVYVHAVLDENGDIGTSLHFVSADELEEEKVVAVPREILYSMGKPTGLSVSFKGHDTFLKIMHEDENPRGVVVYKIIENDFVKVAEAKFDQPYYFFQDNGGLAESEKILLLQSAADRTSQYPILSVYDLKTGVMTMAPQRGDRFLWPNFSQDGGSYVYISEQANEVCWVLNEASVETMLVCKPRYDPNINAVGGYVFNMASAVWSPDMKYVALTMVYVQIDSQVTETLYIVDVRASKIVAEVNDAGEVYDMVWSPDSKLVGFSFLRYPTAGTGLYTLGINGNLRLEYANPEWTNNDSPGSDDARFLLWFVGWLK